VGATDRLQVTRENYFPPAQIRAEVEVKLAQVRAGGDRVDYLTFVPDGEPTLDVALGDSIDLLKPLGERIAVITNGSLLTDPTVQADLLKADYVSIKVDSVDEGRWRMVNRPERRLRLDRILRAIEHFAGIFKGTLVTETMLVRGLNDDESNLMELGRYLSGLKPSTAYLSIPTRPPAEGWVQPPSPEVLDRAFETWAGVVQNPELLTAYEGSDIGSSGEIEEDVLAIASVHPIREDTLRLMVVTAKADWSVIEELLRGRKLIQKEYAGKRFYVRNLKL
jgi:wyosine [tRNA(Phe)-imidazoG37] synthetase (radical SAM superfamily)